jgi:flagellar L-ring protein precursor FlgH
MQKKISVFLSVALLSNCSYYTERLKQVGKAPPIEQVEIPMQKEDYKPIVWPSDPTQQLATLPENKNSLWKPGARTFFRDQRARRVGDILKVTININNNANLNNKTEQVRTTKENSSAPNLYGFENKLTKLFKGKFNPATLLNITGSDDNVGSGTIARQEAIKTEVAAMVTQILPNGNLVIKGHQQVRVNFELREVLVEGIVRPEDISSTNEVSSDLIAEARISYGGKGNITNLQQPRIGNQILDVVSPF